MAKKDDRWKRPIGVERRYRAEIDRLLDKYFSLPNAASLGEIAGRLVDWGHIDRLFTMGAERAASSMVTGVAAHNMKSWKEAAEYSTKGPRIYMLLRREMAGPVGAVAQAHVRENARLIKSLPPKVAIEASQYFMELQQSGERASTITKEMRGKLRDLSAFQIDRLARTETAKAETAITQARSEHLGLTWYEWNTSEDAIVRPSHRIMDKVLVRFADPPSPEALIGKRSSLGHYNAGQAPWCRCGAYPLTSLSEVRWPHKVYYNGVITRMGRAAFISIAPEYRLAA
jgi:SPP1 gp7 family putative phage head morphogenesis protein